MQAADVATKNAPFVTFQLSGNYLETLIKPSDKNTASADSTMTMITSMGSVLTSLRNYFQFANPNSENEINDFLESYLKNILQPVQTWISSHQNEQKTNNALIDFFAIQYQTRNNTKDWVTTKASLVGSDINKWWQSGSTGKIENIDDLKHVIFGLGGKTTKPFENYKFNFINSTNKYLYDSNSEAKDFNKDEKDGEGRYFSGIRATEGIPSLQSQTNLGSYYEITNNIISVMMKEILFKDSTIDKDHIVNRNLKQEVFRNEILLKQTQINSQDTRILSNRPSIVTNVKDKNNKKLYIPVHNYTMAKEIESDISQTALGFTFKVLSVEEYHQEINSIMLYSTLVVLLILCVLIMIFMLFSYRLLGLFAIILAAISASLTLLLPIIFSISVGPGIFAVIFICVGLVLDTSIIYFEAFKKNIYLEKRSPEASFKISNKDTLTILLDASFIILIPTILLFIFGTGSLKGLATIGVISTLFVIVFGILGLRLLTWLTIKDKTFIKHPWLLPLNTQTNSESNIINDFKLSYYAFKIENINAKTKLTSKDLAKLKQAKDKYDFYKQREAEIIQAKKAKQLAKDSQKIIKLNTKIEKLNKSLDTRSSFSAYKKSRIKDLNTNRDFILAKLNTQTSKEELDNLKNKTNQRKIFNINKIFTIFFVIFVILGIGLGFSIGPNYDASFGNSYSITMYGNQIRDIYSNLDANFNAYLSKTDPNDPNRVNEIKAMGTFLKTRKASLDAFKKNEFNKEYLALSVQDQNQWAAFVVSEIFKSIVDNKYLKLWNSNVRVGGVLGANVQVEHGSNFKDVKTSAESATDLAWISFRITNSKDQAIINVFEKLFYSFWKGNADPDAAASKYNHSNNTSDQGIINLINTPYTSFGQIKEMSIVFGITLIALAVYMIIRFKWTYFVALALSVIVTMLLTTSLVVVLRVPVGIEILSAIIAVLSFTIITSILILGKGKSIMKSKSLEAFSVIFEKEVDSSLELKTIKRQTKQELSNLKKEFKASLAVEIAQRAEQKNVQKHLWWFKQTQKFNLIFNKKQNQVYKEYKLKRKELKSAIKNQRATVKHKLDTFVSSNVFLKEIFINIFKFGINRTLLVTSIYIIFALIISLLMPPIIGMGITIIIGILISTLVSLLIALPIWILLERKRIIYILGYKRFVQNYKVSQEEQIIVGIND
ncbi:protein translocase SecDF, variant type [Mycoplasma putrefaciens]|uniref:protein translocase SecDF, variant type n=1 Tax=Mycoplasma putrefaciens TaxID=2123 RepID=UPI0003A1FAE0|nr:protein translocase SecDF, variant type [Mycoplasma putrefaciens]